MVSARRKGETERDRPWKLGPCYRVGVAHIQRPGTSANLSPVSGSSARSTSPHRERERESTLRPAFTYLLISLGPRLHPPTPPAILVIRTGRGSPDPGEKNLPELLRTESSILSSSSRYRRRFFSQSFSERDDRWLDDRISREQLTFGGEVLQEVLDMGTRGGWL